jgi:hypothetical protein
LKQTNDGIQQQSAVHRAHRRIAYYGEVVAKVADAVHFDAHEDRQAGEEEE